MPNGMISAYLQEYEGGVCLQIVSSGWTPCLLKGSGMKRRGSAARAGTSVLLPFGA